MRAEQWPASKVTMCPLDEILPYRQNPRTHSQDQLELLAKSMNENGVTTPILVDEHGVIIAGHGRLLAAQMNGFEHYPVVVARGWSETKKRAVRIQDNQLALLAGWDLDMIRLELGELTLAGYELPLLGFDETALAAFLDTNQGLIDPDEVQELPKVPVSRVGDLWHLGRHRLLCGDATKAEDVARALGTNKPHLMVTDPPYGVDYDPGWRNKIQFCEGRAIGQVTNDDRSDWRDAWALFSGDVAYVWHAGQYAGMVQGSLESVGLQTRSQIIWDKTRIVFGRSDYHWQHEPCWYAVRKGRTAHWNGDRTQATVWQIPKSQKLETGHGTQKPVECMKRPIENNSKAGDAVYDPFVGSGTTVIAAEMTGRKALTIEIDPRYVDCSVERWQNFTGRKATLDGKTFDELALARREASSKPDEKRGRLEAAPISA